MIIFMQDARKSLMTVFVLAYHTLQTERTAKDASPTCMQQIPGTIWREIKENLANQDKTGP